VPFAVVGAIAAGAMGIRPDARSGTIETRSGLTAATPWAELRGVPVFDGLIDVRHEGRRKTTMRARSGSGFVWRAVFEGRWDELEIDGSRTKAGHSFADEAGLPVSWVEVEIAAGQEVSVTAPSAPAPGDKEERER